MPQRDKNRAYCLLDTPNPVRLNAREYAIKGWFLPQSEPADIPHLKLRVDGRDFDVVTGLPRPDVAEHFRDPYAVNSGFIARFDAPITNPQITLFAHVASKEVILHQIHTDLTLNAVPLARRAANYLEWLTNCEPHLFWPEAEVRQRVSHLSWLPLISVLVVTYDTDPYLLRRCIGSVLRQHYSHFELWVVDNCSRDGRVGEFLYQVGSQDSRVHVIPFGERHDISTAYNHALMAAQGEIVTFLNQSDELHPFALLEIVRLLNANLNAELVYSDDDRIDYLGVRSQPAFKPDFDIDAFLSFNYLGHLMAVKRALALHVQGFRSSCDGARDWDFLLRSIEHIDAMDVQHIRKPLYHRRIDGNPAMINSHVDRKALQRTLSEHVQRTGRLAKVEDGLFEGSMRLRYDYPKSVKIGVFLRAEDGIFQTLVLSPNVNGHRTAVYEFIDCVVRRATISFRKEFSGSSASDLAARALISLDEIDDDVFVFINAPLETINHFFIEELVSQAMRDDCGLVSGLSLDSNNHILHSGYVSANGGELLDLFAGETFSNSGYLGQLATVRAVEAVSDHFFAVRREHLVAIGGLGSISASHMPQLVCKLLQNAANQNLRVLVTPYAVAVFDGITCSARPEGYSPSFARVKANPNLVAFSDSRTLCKDSQASSMEVDDTASSVR